MRSKRMLVLSLVILVLGLLAVVMLTGCGSSDETTTTAAAETTTTAAPTETTAAPTETTAAPTETTAAAAFDGTIRIGALGSMTGGNAMNGAETIWAQEKAVEDINAAGGVTVDGKKMELELVFVDDKSDPNEGAAAVEKLIKVEGIKLILSTMVSSINMPAAIVAEKYQALYHQVGTWSSVAREQNWQWSTDIFYSPKDAAAMPFLLWKPQPADATWSKWCILNEDNADGQAFGKGMEATAKAFGATIVAWETFTPGTKDFSSAILKFKEAGGDALVTLQAPPDAITFAKQLEEQNWSPKFIMGGRGFWPVEFPAALGPASDYFVHDGFWSEALPYPGCKELGEAYTASHDGATSVSVGLPYAQVQILAEAIERAGSTDPGAVRDQIWNGTFEGTMIGDITYDEMGVCDILPLLLQWIDAERVLVFPGHEIGVEAVRSLG